MEYTFLEWNIQGAGGDTNYSMPEFIADTIYDKKKDIVVLVEFIIGTNFNYLRDKLQEEYFIFVSSFALGYNQVMIALRKEKFSDKNIIKVITCNILDISCPEYLQLDIIDKEENEFSIIGARIKSQNTTEIREKQFLFLDNIFKELNKGICLGDFNVTSSNADKFIEFATVYGSVTKNSMRWSFVHENGDKVGIDLIAAKGIDIQRDEEDELCKMNKKMYAKYDWEFVCKENGYGNLTSEDYLTTFRGRPNHAILIGKFKVEKL